MAEPITPKAKAVLERLEVLEDAHMRMRGIWRDIAALVIPRVDFDNMAPGQRRDLEKWDDTAPLANYVCASQVHSAAMPANSAWFALADEDEGFNVPRAQRVFFEQASDYLHRIFAQPRRNFYTSSHEAMQETTSLGTGPVYFGDKRGFGSWYKSIPLSQSRIAGLDNIGPKAKAMADANDRAPLTCIHAVEPRVGGIKGAFAGKKPFQSIYMIKEHAHIISESGYDFFPYGVPRNSRRSGEMYGWGFGGENLASIKFVNEIALRLIQATQLGVAPPMWVPAEGLLNDLSLEPWAHNYFEGDRPGQEAPKALDLGSRNLPVGFEILKSTQDAIRRGFAVDWLDGQTREMTRLQFQLNRDDRLKLQSPMLGRMTAELAGPAVERTFEIEWANRRLPQPPADLIRKGVKLVVSYQSPLTRLQRYGEIEAIQSTAEMAMALAKVDPRATYVMDVVKTIEAPLTHYATSLRRSAKRRRPRQRPCRPGRRPRAMPPTP